MTSLLGLVAAAIFMANSAVAQTATFDQRAEQGRELFVHQWQPNDPLTPNGDGLGPAYNATSCVACHSRGGVGGSGAKQNNVEILAVLPEPGEPTVSHERSFLNRLKETHPMFVDSLDRYFIGVILHRHNTTPGYDEFYNDLTTPLEVSISSRSRIRRMLKRRNMAFLSQLPMRLVGYKKDLQYVIAERNPPQLFGLDLIDRGIKESDIRAIAQAQKASNSGVSGRFTGRYGWRGQLNSLDDFVKGACAAELGLQVAEMNQAPNPLDPEYRIDQPDLDESQTEKLIAFVRSLPRPELGMPNDPNDRSHVTQGQVLFSQIGCAECHVPDVGTVTGVYSDFLLHNMGESFEDPIPAKKIPSYLVTAGISDVVIDVGQEERYKHDKRATEKANKEGKESFDKTVKAVNQAVADGTMLPYYGIDPNTTQFTPQQGPDRNSSKYDNKTYGSTRTIQFETIEEQNHYKEYRTPALWGVGDSGPYMHDGRADTLRAAIEWHGGEAYRSMMAFSALSEEQQTSVLKFLEALKAPQTAERAPAWLTEEQPVTPPADGKLSSVR